MWLPAVRTPESPRPCSWKTTASPAAGTARTRLSAVSGKGVTRTGARTSFFPRRTTLRPMRTGGGIPYAYQEIGRGKCSHVRDNRLLEHAGGRERGDFARPHYAHDQQHVRARAGQRRRVAVAAKRSGARTQASGYTRPLAGWTSADGHGGRLSPHRLNVASQSHMFATTFTKRLMTLILTI